MFIKWRKFQTFGANALTEMADSSEPPILESDPLTMKLPLVAHPLISIISKPVMVTVVLHEIG